MAEAVAGASSPAAPSSETPKELDLSDGKLSLSVFPSLFAIIRLDHDVELPRFLALNVSKPSPQVPRPAFLSVTRTFEETSIVVSPFLSSEQLAASGFPTAIVEGPYKCIRVKGPLALSGYVGTMARLSAVMKDQGISIFALSSYDTDFLLVPQERSDDAVEALKKDGWQFPE